MSRIFKNLFILIIFFSFFLFGRDSRIVDAEWQGNKFVIKFDKKPKNIDIDDNIFQKQKRFSHSFYIKDIASKNNWTISKSSEDVPNIKISNKSNNTQIVFNDENKININWKLEGKNLVFYFDKKNRKNRTEKIVTELKDMDIYTSKKSKRRKISRTRIVTLDPGHGGKDSGAICKFYKSMEKDIVLEVSKYVKKALEKKGYLVKMTRDSDKFIELIKRTQIANNNNSDIFVSIHVNSIPKNGNFKRKNGIETFFLSPARSERSNRVAMKENSDDLYYSSHYGKSHYVSTINHMKIIKSHRLALDIQTSIVNTVRSKYRSVADDGVSEAPFWVLVGAQMPAVLIELGYIAGYIDGYRLLQPDYQRIIGAGISRGIDNYFDNNNF